VHTLLAFGVLHFGFESAMHKSGDKRIRLRTPVQGAGHSNHPNLDLRGGQAVLQLVQPCRQHMIGSGAVTKRH
jgi:hypothetical protein